MNGKFFNICRGGYINIRIINVFVLMMINGKWVVSVSDVEIVNNVILVLVIYMWLFFNFLNIL